MVFSSSPLYLDPPNWNNSQQQQQQQQQQVSHGQFQSGGGGGLEAHHHHHHQQQQQRQQQNLHQQQLPPVPPPPPGALMASRLDIVGAGSTAVSGGGGGGGGGGQTGGSSVRPGSMTERQRLAKIQQPEPGLKCPRCFSTNTKFCYFNNYSLLQPRYFCKLCRRYWTDGGTLRNVPVGGGCRRNKRTKSSKSAAAASSSAASAPTGGTSSSTSSTAAGAAAAIMPPQGHSPQMPFFASLHPAGGGSDHYGAGASRLGFPGLSSMDPLDYQVGGGAAGAAVAAMGLEQWRLPQIQQFPFFSRTDAMQQQMAGIYPFDAEAAAADASGFAGQMLGGVAKQVPGSAGLITQLASVKMEDIPPANPMASVSAREFLGLPGNLQFWGGGGNDDGAGNNNIGGNATGADAIAQVGGGGWVDLSAFNSSSSGNML